jgi:NAD-dependent DNA ligase
MPWDPTPLERIERLRRQLHVHSILYYHMDASYVSDAIFDEWANELVRLNKLHPELVEQGDKWEIFADWTGDTGMHLPVDERVVSLAHSLLNHRRRNNLTEDIL